MAKDKFTREWITINSLEEIQNYEKGVLTLRALHYRMVARGMTNTLQHYKRVVSAMIKARWDGSVDFDTFSDHDRDVLGSTHYDQTSVESEQSAAKRQIRAWMNSYNKNRWENQSTYVEVWIEKKALIGTFQPICNEYGVALAPCKGYPSLTFLNEARYRFDHAKDTHDLKILYFGDYDPSGEDIPRSIGENLQQMGIDVEVDRRLLLKEDVLKYNLPPAPVKLKDSRTASWDGLGQVELDAVEPKELQRILEESIMEQMDDGLYADLKENEEEERIIFKANLKKFVKSL